MKSIQQTAYVKKKKKEAIGSSRQAEQE